MSYSILGTTLSDRVRLRKEHLKRLDVIIEKQAEFRLLEEELKKTDWIFQYCETCKGRCYNCCYWLNCYKECKNYGKSCKHFKHPEMYFCKNCSGAFCHCHKPDAPSNLCKKCAAVEATQNSDSRKHKKMRTMEKESL